MKFPDGQTCETCRFWDGGWESDVEDQTEGMCLRFPPCQAIEGNVGDFPITYNINWCGEWASKPEQEKPCLK